ncbi:MAG TPA: carbohydrate ABC transporter permease [Actinoplanes sp.]|nr:carbohydrate ABC transporter permease [Actinoplanes sp.]
MTTFVEGTAPVTDNPPEGPRRGRRPGGAKRVLQYAVLVILTILFVSPLVYMAVTSFKTQADAISPDPQWIPANPTTEAYDATLGSSDTPVLRWFLNSVVAATAQSLLVVATAALAAYALARMDFRGKRLIFGTIVATLFVPAVILIIPNYIIVSELAWLDSLTAVIVPGAASAFGVFFLRQFFTSLPEELEEAAYVDGAGPFRIFWSVVLPLSKPALATLALLAFLTNWNDFLWPLYVLFSAEQQTLPAGLATLQNANAVRYDLLMAGAMIAAVPVLLLYLVAQRFVIEGVSRTGLKG